MNSQDWINSTPSEKALWKYAASLLVGVQTVTEMVFTGAITGSEFLTYSAKKIYVGLNVKISGDFTARASVATIRFYNQANALMFNYNNPFIYWDTAVPGMKVFHNPFVLNNIWFSRIDQTSTYYDWINFIGYKITIP